MRRGEGINASFVAPLAARAAVDGASGNAAASGAPRADESIRAVGARHQNLDAWV
jgi:hypothetical protein